MNSEGLGKTKQVPACRVKLPLEKSVTYNLVLESESFMFHRASDDILYRSSVASTMAYSGSFNRWNNTRKLCSGTT